MFELSKDQRHLLDILHKSNVTEIFLGYDRQPPYVFIITKDVFNRFNKKVVFSYSFFRFLKFTNIITYYRKVDLDIYQYSIDILYISKLLEHI